MKPNFSTIRTISFIRKANILNYQYTLGSSVILRTDCIKNFGVHIDCKFSFHRLVYFISSYALKLLGLIRKILFTLHIRQSTDATSMFCFGHI
jgi:hypothetical protein